MRDGAAKECYLTPGLMLVQTEIPGSDVLPFYLQRKITLCTIFSVYISPQANINITFTILLAKTDAALITMREYNKANLCTASYNTQLMTKDI